MSTAATKKMPEMSVFPRLQTGKVCVKPPIRLLKLFFFFNLSVPCSASRFHQLTLSYSSLAGAKSKAGNTVSIGGHRLRLTVNILVFIRRTVNFFPLRLTDLLKINCVALKINDPIQETIWDTSKDFHTKRYSILPAMCGLFVFLLCGTFCRIVKSIGFSRHKDS